MPHLVRFLMRHALIGFALAILFVGALLAFDVARLGSLVRASSTGGLAALILVFSVGVTFSSVQMGFAVMLLASRDEEPGSGRRRTIPARRLRLAELRVPGRRTGQD